MEIAMLRVVVVLWFLFGGLSLSAIAGELDEVIAAQHNFFNKAKALEQKIAPQKMATPKGIDPMPSVTRLFDDIDGYIDAKKNLQTQVEKNFSELKAQISHQKLPTFEGIELSMQMKEFSAERLKALEDNIIVNLKKYPSDERALKATSELTRLQNNGVEIYKRLM
jgi:hypothetical protein